MFQNQKKNRGQISQESLRKTIGDNLSFGAAEAYKLLRTNLEFSFPEKTGCKVIGITSPLKGEGKSTTSVNIAYTTAQTGKKVLLMEADLRQPILAKRLRLHTKPGISNLLVGQCSGNDILQKSGLLPNLWVTTAGDIPPNPAELLASEPMAVTVKTMCQFFDEIFVDLPPVTVVSDAVIASKLLDGVVLVVRQGYCDRGSLDETVRKLRFAGTRILGFVMTDSDEQHKGYRHYGKDYGYYRQPNAEGGAGK